VEAVEQREVGQIGEGYWDIFPKVRGAYAREQAMHSVQLP
jgi:hypothetical protein